MTTLYYSFDNSIFDKIDEMENGKTFQTRVIRYSDKHELWKQEIPYFNHDVNFISCSKATFLEKLNQVVEFYKNELFQESFK